MDGLFRYLHKKKVEQKILVIKKMLKQATEIK